MKVYRCYEGAEMVFRMTSVLGLQAPVPISLSHFSTFYIFSEQ